MYKNLLLVGLLLYAQAYCFAQKTPGTVPYWVSVMANDSTANYFQALQSFKEYWEGKELPMENDEYISEGRRERKLEHNREIREHRKEEREHEKEEHEREERFHAQEHLYDADFKRFLRWKDDMFVFVREDGSIPSLEERIKIINAQR